MDMKFDAAKENLLKNKIMAIGVGMALIAVWYLYGSVYKGTVVAIREVNGQIENEQQGGEIAKEVAGLQTVVAKYRSYFVKGKDESWLVDKVSRAANEAGLTIVSLNPRPLSDAGAFIYVGLSLSASGTYHQLGDFIGRLENSREFIRIEKLSFKKSEQALKADVQIASYFIR